jgi:hypothetical protein
MVSLLFVFCKMRLKVWPGMLRVVAVIQCTVNGVVIDASFLKRDERELYGGSVGNGSTPVGCRFANDLDAFPKVFEWFVGVPSLGELGVVVFKVGRGELAILVTRSIVISGTVTSAYPNLSSPNHWK